MTGVSLPSFEFFIVLIQLGQKLLTFCGYFVRFCLGNWILANSSCRLNDDLRFHVDLSVFIFHHNDSRLCWRLRNFDFLDSWLIGRLLNGIVRIRSSTKSCAGSSMKSANKVIN